LAFPYDTSDQSSSWVLNWDHYHPVWWLQVEFRDASDVPDRCLLLNIICHFLGYTNFNVHGTSCFLCFCLLRISAFFRYISSPLIIVHPIWPSNGFWAPFDSILELLFWSRTLFWFVVACFFTVSSFYSSLQIYLHQSHLLPAFVSYSMNTEVNIWASHSLAGLAFGWINNNQQVSQQCA